MRHKRYFSHLPALSRLPRELAQAKIYKLVRHNIKTPQLSLRSFKVHSYTAVLIVMGGVRNVLSTMRDVLASAGNRIAGG
jgi:hypothetical protein